MFGEPQRRHASPTGDSEPASDGDLEPAADWGGGSAFISETPRSLRGRGEALNLSTHMYNIHTLLAYILESRYDDDDGQGL